MAARVSHKRGRSWLEIGVAGCSLLASPVHAAWWPFTYGTVWPNLLVQASQIPLPPPRHHRNHHQRPYVRSSSNDPRARRVPDGTGSLRGEATTAGAAAAVGGAPGGEGSVDLDRVYLRRLEVKAGFTAAVGDWSECSRATCTQSRKVFCETNDFKIVSDTLCGDELPSTEQACPVEDACGSEPQEQDRENTPAMTVETHEEAVAAAPPRGKQAGDVRPAARKDKDGAAGAAVEAASSEKKTPSGGSRGRGVGTPDVESDVAVGSTVTESSNQTSPHAENRPAAEAAARNDGTGGGEGKQGGMDSRDSKGEQKEEGEGVSGAELDRAVADGDGDSAVGSARDAEPAAPSRQQTDTNSGNNSSNGKPAFAVKTQQDVTQMKSDGASRAEDRFWTVLAIGAGAVGSFLAAVVFAVGQYRKEQHRLRGIMALNEFPQDNYINPFARQVTDEDRSAFNL